MTTESDINSLQDYPDYSKPFYLKWDKWALTADWHLPFLQKGLFKKLICKCQKEKVKNIFIGGDFFDLNAFSHFFQYHRIPWEQERSFAAKVFQILSKTFDHIAFMVSNHEVRFLRALAPQVQGCANIYDLYRLIGFNKVDMITLKQGAVIGNWIVVHPKNARKIPLSLGREIASQYTDKNIALTHAHLQALGKTQDGNRWLFDCGCMCDPGKIEYKNYIVTAHFAWNPGFAIINNGNLDVVWGDV